VAPTRTVLPPTQLFYCRKQIVVNSLFQHNSIGATPEEEGTDGSVRIVAKNDTPDIWISTANCCELISHPGIRKGSPEDDNIPVAFPQGTGQFLNGCSLPDGSGNTFFHQELPDAGTNVSMSVADYDIQIATQEATMH
jgi:hypothetical protein